MSVLANPLVGLLIFALVGWGIFRLGGRWAARGQESRGKYLPYACGEDLLPRGQQLSYERFFRLALMFVAVHVAALVVALLPSALGGRLLATVYLLGAGTCMYILLAEGSENDG